MLARAMYKAQLQRAQYEQRIRWDQPGQQNGLYVTLTSGLF